MKLYISDLDGTLLNGNKELSDYTKETLNSLIARGVNFSIATARTAASSVKILSGLNINAPVVLMNGVIVYDIKERKYIKIEEIQYKTAVDIVEAFRKNGITGFMYSISDNELVTFYENLGTKALKDFYDERVMRYYKSFEQVGCFMDKIKDSKIIYFTLVDEYERLSDVYHILQNHTDIDTVLYKDIYADDLWYLEVYSKNASKYNAVKFLRDHFKYGNIVGFGDNLNDIPLFKACDECYAVSNAVEELKTLATGVIDSNLSNGVARFIEEKEG